MNVAATSPAAPLSFVGIDAPVACAPDETILFAGLRAGLSLPYECASGGCGTCRAQLLQGSVLTRWNEATGLSERDRRKGDRILMCQSVPREPCRLKAPTDAGPAQSEPRPARCTGRLIERDMLNPDIARFLVDLDGAVPYLPGQFVLLEFADGVRRAYSMTRPMHREQPSKLELLVREKPGGAASAWLFHRLQPGAHLTIEGPYGRAYAQSPPDRPVLCLAGGTGLAPVLAIAQHLSAQSPQRRIDVYVGSRHVEDIVLADRLAALGAAGTQVIYVVEQQHHQQHPQLGSTRVGLALDHLADDWPDLTGHDLYLAGPTPMIYAALRQLVRQGTARADRVFFDRFVA